MGVRVLVVADVSSDHYTFQSPVQQGGAYSWNWNLDSGILAARSVPSNSLLFSCPLTVTDLWEMGEPGWIHTKKDFSDTPSWVKEENLEAHVKVTLLTIIDLGDFEEEDRIPILVLLGVSVALISITVIWRLRRH